MITSYLTTQSIQAVTFLFLFFMVKRIDDGKGTVISSFFYKDICLTYPISRFHFHVLVS